MEGLPCVRLVLYAVAAVGIAILAPPAAIRSALATTASALLEATPWILGGIALSTVVRNRRITAYLGCGCGRGPSARSVPAAAATCLIFGPVVAVARFAAAVAAARLFSRSTAAHDHTRSIDLLDELYALLPTATIAGVVMQATAAIDLRAYSPALQALTGLILGFLASPCALGAVAVAGALHVRAPLAATAFLCVAGIVDLRVVRCWQMHETPHARSRHDALAYALLSIALAAVALHRGNALVHPAIARVLGASALVTLFCTMAYRSRASPSARIAPAIMLLGALVTAPPPLYSATETTMSDVFPGEHLSFTGVLSRNGRSAALVRYAITCCRADAAPIAIRLSKPPPFAATTWLHADGVVESDERGFALAAIRVTAIAPPLDPFIYR